MSLTGRLLALAIRHAFHIAADGAIAALEQRLADHSLALPKALARANDRAWDAIGLALAGDGLFEWIRDAFRDGDLKGVRDQIKGFLRQTPTGLEETTAPRRAEAAREWARLRKAQKLAAANPSPAELARQAAALERHADPARLAAAAHQAVRETADAIRAEAPYLAELLTVAPPDGTPLLAAAFTFFFRREVETSTELAHGLSFDFLRVLCERQEHGLALLDNRTAEVLQQFTALFDLLRDWFAVQEERHAALHAKMDEVLRRHNVSTEVDAPRKVSVTTRVQLELVELLWGQVRGLPPELVPAATWTKVGDLLAAAGQIEEANRAHATAAATARAVDDPAAEAEAEYKRFRDACEGDDPVAPLTPFRRAVALAPERFAPFDLHRYAPSAVLGVGAFGTVFAAEDDYVRVGVGGERRPRRVAIKVINDGAWDDLLERDPADTFDEADTLSALNHPGIIRSLDRGFGDPRRRRRPFLVLEFFPGTTLEALLRARGPLPLRDVLEIGLRIAEAVHAAHQVGVLHRDLKPANVMVRFDDAARRWQVKVIDFGLAVKLEAARVSKDVPAGRRAALDRGLAGTLRYAPPEQRRDLDAPPGPYSDVYAWGKTCLDLLFAETEPKSLHWKRLPAEHRAEVQELFDAATMGELEHRTQDFSPVLEALAALLGDRPESETATRPVEPATTRRETPPTRTSEPPGNPRAGEVFTLRIVGPERARTPGDIPSAPIPGPERGEKAGTLTSLSWKPVPPRRNPRA